MSHDPTLSESAVLRALIDSSTSPMWAVNRDYEYLAFNQAHYQRTFEIYGTRISVAENMLDAIVVPIERELMRSHVAQALAGVTHTDARWFGQGTRLRRYHEITFMPVFADDEVAGAAMSAHDLTEQALADEKIRTFSAIMDSSSDAMASWDMDGIVTSWSSGAKRLYGYSADEMIGRHLEIILPPGHEGRFPAVMGVVAGGQRVTRLETTGMRKNGTTVEVELTVGPIIDEYGTVVGASAAAHDITERKSMEDALRRSESKYETAFHTSPDSVTISRLRDGVFLEVNDGFTVRTGFSAEEALGTSSLDLGIWADPADRDRFSGLLHAQGRVDNLVLDFRQKNGEVHASAVSARVMDIDGEQCVLSVTRDP